MAKGTLGQVIQRAISDAAFRNRLRTDPGGALSGFDLTPAERAALQSGDAAKLASFGVDQRMSKAFAMGEAASGVSRLVGTDIGMATTITDGGTPLGTNAILEDVSGDARSALDDASGAGRSAIRDGDGPFLAGSVDDDTSGSAQSAIRDGDGPFLAGSVDDTSGSAQSAIRDGDGPFLAGSVEDTAAAGGTSAYLTSDEMGNASAASVAASDDSGGTSAFLTADEMGNDTTGVAGSAASDSDAAIDDTSMANPATYDQAHPTES